MEKPGHIKEHDADIRIYNPRQFDQDVEGMSPEQLNYFIKTSFKGDTDFDFLPPGYWYNYFDYKAYEADGRTPSPAGGYFGHLYVSAGNQGTEESRSLRENLENTFTEMISECLTVEGEPDEKHLWMAWCTIDAINTIYLTDGPNSPVKQFTDLIAKQTSDQGVPMSEVAELYATVEKPSLVSNELFLKVQVLGNDSRYSNLEARLFAWSQQS